MTKIKLLENAIFRTFALVGLNILIFIGLVYMSVFFQFLVLGWGASANALSFNADITSIIQIVIIGLLAYSKKSKELGVVALTIFAMYLILKFGLNVI